MKREERPEFTDIHNQLQHAMERIPVIWRSNSEPTLNRNHWQQEDFTAFTCASPKTPANIHTTSYGGGSAFPFGGA